MDIEAILREHESWLRGRSKRAARELGASRYTLEADADDIFQEVCVSFIEYSREGWFDQRPRINFVAQVRHLFGNCFLHVKTARIRTNKRLKPVADHDDSGQDGLEALLGGEGGEAERHEAIDSEARLRRLEEVVLEGLQPGRRLFVLALRYPALLRREHLLAASQMRIGGARPLRRPIDEAWALYRAQLSRQKPDGDEAHWKKTLAEIFQGTVSLGSLPPADLKKAVNYVDMQYSRAISELKALLGAEGETE